MSEESDVSEPGSGTQPENPTATNGGFSVPEEYKDAGWAKNINSYDDLWKMNANAQSLIGKKTIGIPDERSSDDEWNSFYEKTRPHEPKDYNFDFEGSDKEFYEKLFYDNGISSRQAKGIIGAYQERMKQVVSSMTSDEGFKKEMQTRFGDKYEDRVKSLSSLIAREASGDDKKVLESMPNNVLGIMYGVLDKIATRYAIKDSDTSTAGKSGFSSGQADYAAYVKEAEALTHRPHTTADIDALKMKYNIPVIKR